jgi:hypothetical protein
MRTYHDGFHLFPNEMLFDLKDDPHEQNNLAEKRPEIVREGIAKLTAWQDEQMKRMPTDKIDPLWTVIAEGGPAHAIHAVGRSPLPAYLKRLRATGRADGAAALERKYSAFLPGESR